jgi:NitT/TauT family transport system permease protein
MRRTALGTVLPLSVALLWEGLARGGVLSEDGFSRPTRIVAAGWHALVDGSLLRQTGETFSAAALGLALAAVSGIAAGVLLGMSRRLQRVVGPTVEALRPVPSVALIPLALLIFGFSRTMSAAVAAFACFWPILIFTSAAVRGIEPRLIEVGRMMGFSLLQRSLKLALPAALPEVMVGVRTAAGIAIVVTVTTEIVTNPRGLGFGMTVASQSLQPDLAWATLLWIGVVAWLLNAATLRLERRWLAWYWAARP